MAYSIGDVFIGCPASATGRPYNQPTVLHYASDGTTLIETLTVPDTVATVYEYRVEGVVVGADGRLYVMWSSTENYEKLGVFDIDGSWIGVLVTINPTFGGNMSLYPLPGGDLVVVSPSTDEIIRYDTTGAVVASWTEPTLFAGSRGGECVKPGSADIIIIAQGNDFYTFNTLTEAITGPIAVPYDSGNESISGLYTTQTTVYLAVIVTSSSPYSWYIQPLSADLTSTAGARAELATEDFPGGGVSHFGLINNPWDIAIDASGTVGWGVTYTTDNSHSGTPGDSTFRTGVRNTTIPGGTSSAVQTDVNGDSNLIYVYKGYGCTDLPDTFSNLTLWVEAVTVNAVDGDVVDPWPEAGAITISNADDLAGDAAFGANDAGTYQTNELCSAYPVIQVESSHRGYATTTRVGLAYGTGAPAIFNDLNQFSVAAIGRIASGSDTGAELQLIQTDVVWLRIHNFGDGTGEVRLRINQNAAFQTRNFAWSYTIGNWFLLVVRWDGTTVKAKFNSETEQTALFSSPLQSTELGAGAPVKVGFDSDPVDQVGQVAMVAAWAHYLDDTEAPALISCFTGKYPCLGGGGADIRLRTTQFMRIGAGVGI